MGTKTELPFSKIVYSQTQDEFPGLMKYVTGFHLLDEKDDGNKAIGVEMLRINERPYLLASIFKYGFLKPLVLLLDVTSKQIKALTKRVVGLIQKDSIKVNADLVPEGEDRGMYSRPDLYNMFRPPKLGSEESLPIESKPQRTDQEWEPIFFKVASKKEASFIEDDILLKEKVAKTFGNAMKDLEDGPRNPISVKVRVVTQPRNKEERIRFMGDSSPIIEDFRHPEETSQVSDLEPLQVDMTRIYQNPTTEGFYKVLTCTGEWRDMLFFREPSSTPDYCTRPGNFYDLESKQLYVDIDTRNVYTKECLVRDLPLESTPDEYSSCGILVDPELWKLRKGAFVPIELYRVKESGNFKVYESCSRTVIVDKRVNSGYIDIKDNDVITMGKDTKWLTVKDKQYHSSYFGNIHTVIRNLLLQKPEMKILNNDSGILTIKDSRGNVKEISKIALLQEYNVSLEDAKEILSKKKGSFLIKRAFNFIPQEYPVLEYNMDQLPFIPDDYDGTVVTPHDSIGHAVQVTDQGDVPTSSPSTGISNEALIRSAMSAESPLIVDASLFGVLANSATSTERIKQLIPLLNKMVHQLGILYFDICWHTEDFTNDYTSEELYDLEDSVLTTFKSLQDISISLAQRKRLYGTQD